MSQTIAEPRVRQGCEPPADLEPFLILRRRDDSLIVAARASDGVVYLAPLRSVPKPPRRKLIECCCCGRPLVWSEFEDGHATLLPIEKQPCAAADDDIPFG